jgi:hypothetical protein
MLRQSIALAFTFVAIYIADRYFDGIFGKLGMYAILLSGQLVGWISARIIVEMFSAVHEQAHYDAYADLNGTHYAFDNHSLRFYQVDGVTWVAADDVIPILQPPPDARELRFLGDEHAEIPGQGIKGISEAGLLRLMTTRTAHRRATRDMVRLKAWLEDETLPNLKRLPSSYTAQIATGRVRKSEGTKEEA